MAGAKHLPYVNAYGSIKDLFLAIQKAAVPTKFSQDFLSTKLGLKSSSHRALIPLLKRLGFVDPNNVPTDAYKGYRDPKKAKAVMGAQLRTAYSDLFTADQYAYELKKEDLVSKLANITGAAADDAALSATAATFIALRDLASFEAESEEAAEKIPDPPKTPPKEVEHGQRHRKLGISYTINLNLPATTEVEVFNAIFKSLKEHILDE